MTLPGQGDGYFIKGMGSTPGQGELLTQPRGPGKVKGQGRPGPTTLRQDMLGVGGVLENLNTASSLKSPRTRPFTAPEFCSNSQQGIEGGGFWLALPAGIPQTAAVTGSISYCPGRHRPRPSFQPQGRPTHPCPARGKANCPGNICGGRAQNCSLQGIPGG